MAGTRRSTRRSTATQPFSPTSEAKRPQLKASRATPSRRAATPKSASKSRSPSPAAARRSPSPAASSRTADSYVTPSEFSSSPATEWEPSILGLPSTDLLSVAICAFLGGWYVYTHEAKPTGPALHATAVASAWLTAFGGGLISHTMLTLATMSTVNDSSAHLRNAFAPGTLGFQQKPAIVAALVGFAAAVPTGHPYDALSIDADIFRAMDCLNWGILVGWAVSKLAVLAKDAPSPPPSVLLVIAFPAGYAYCAAGGMTRNLLFTAIFTPSVELPTNLLPEVAVPMAFGFAAYAVILQLTQSVLPPIRSIDPLLGIPAVAYIFYVAATYFQLGGKTWNTPIDVPQLSLMSLLSSGGDLSAMVVGDPTSHPAATVMLTPVLLYLVAGLRR
eukprot:COSAG02_NODE_3013_length_7552_cov_11.893734_2_plen_389_part_00